MSEIIRFGVSMEKELVEELDKLTINQNYANRSEAIRSLVRKELVANSHGSAASNRRQWGVIF